MQEKFTFEYAIIRVVPRVEREEFLNVGVIVFCKRPAFLDMQYVLDEKRILAIYPKIDLEDRRNLPLPVTVQAPAVDRQDLLLEYRVQIAVHEFEQTGTQDKIS